VSNRPAIDAAFLQRAAGDRLRVHHAGFDEVFVRQSRREAHYLSLPQTQYKQGGIGGKNGGGGTQKYKIMKNVRGGGQETATDACDFGVEDRHEHGQRAEHGTCVGGGQRATPAARCRTSRGAAHGDRKKVVLGENYTQSATLCLLAFHVLRLRYGADGLLIHFNNVGETFAAGQSGLAFFFRNDRSYGSVRLEPI